MSANYAGWHLLKFIVLTASRSVPRCRHAGNEVVANVANRLIGSLSEVYQEQSGKAFEDYFRAAVYALVKANGYSRFESAQVR